MHPPSLLSLMLNLIVAPRPPPLGPTYCCSHLSCPRPRLHPRPGCIPCPSFANIIAGLRLLVLDPFGFPLRDLARGNLCYRVFLSLCRKTIGFSFRRRGRHGSFRGFLLCQRGFALVDGTLHRTASPATCNGQLASAHGSIMPLTGSTHSSWNATSSPTLSSWSNLSPHRHRYRYRHRHCRRRRPS